MFQKYTNLVDKLKRIKKHIVIILKELNYRSVLYPLSVKLKIGARMGRFSKSPSMDTIAQNQRMCGYGLKPYFDNDYKLGPFREDVHMIKQYIEWSEGKNIKYSGRLKRQLMYESKTVGIYKKERNIIHGSSAIPVRLEIKDNILFNTLVSLRTKHKSGYKKTFDNLLKNGIMKKQILMEDKNIINKFDIQNRKLKSIRMYKDGDDKKSRRIKQFYNAFEKCKPASQKGDSTEYSIDFCRTDYILDDFVNKSSIMWITFRV